MPVATPSPASLTTPATTFPRTKYFPIELYLANMLPNTTYDAYVDGQLVNAFCRPFGGNLGSPLTSDVNGRLIVQYQVAVPYNQQFIVNPVASNTNLVSAQKIISFVDPFGKTSSTVLPFILKSS